MSNAESVNNLYFAWLVDNINDGRSVVRFNSLLRHLHNVEFTYTLEMDSNRALDGEYLRHEFAYEMDEDDPRTYLDCLTGPCSVLEMMVALAVRCEETIMDDTRYGNRTSLWFWGMISNLGLNGMDDSHYNPIRTNRILDIFLNRDYEPNGRGGLFTVENCDQDLRDVEIWYQLNWYLSGIVGI